MGIGLDPSIILASKQYTGPDANETARTLSQLALQGVQQQHAQMSLADMARQQGQEQSLRSIYQANAQTPGGLSSALMAGGFGKEALGVQGQQAEIGSRDAAAKLASEKAMHEKIQVLARPLMGVSDDAGIAAAKQVWAKMGATSEELAQFPDSYVQAKPYIEAFTKSAIPADKQASLAAAAIENDKKRTFDSEQNDRNRANKTTNAGIIAGTKAADGARDEVTKLRKEIDSNKAVAKYRGASAELQSLKELAKDASGANDMALVFAFMKAMDPESVVRESEYSAAAATGTPDQRMMGLVSKYWTGGPLSNGQRAAFIKAAEAAQSGHKAAFGKAVKTYRHVAAKHDYDLEELGLADDGPKSGGLDEAERSELDQLRKELGQ